MTRLQRALDTRVQAYATKWALGDLVLLAETPAMPAWVSFSCRDGRHISDGTPLADCAARLRSPSLRNRIARAPVPFRNEQDARGY